jgi:hypothetical protein
MTLDPIVSLSVAVAEAPGSHAFFLGSGISQEAGVPTGQQVFWQAAGEMYRLDKETEETPDEDGLREWLKESDRDQLGYSDLLELIAPDPANRRDYLAKHFEGREPGKAHQQLAALAEHALQARGIEPVLITSAADLASAPRREHASCYVLKPHGDYLQETIRNTPSELEQLEPEIADELREIFERFGVVVLGYSGSDAAIAELMSTRRSRYGLYWVARGELSSGASRIIEATGGRVIQRPDAANFLRDLQRRLEVFRAYPSGHTPVEVHDEVLALVRAGDQIGLAEVMRRERRELAEGMQAIVSGRAREQPEEKRLLEAHDQALPLWERRLASLLPVIAYAPEYFEREVRSLLDLVENRPLEDGYTAWRELSEWGTWWLGYACGAFALFQEAWPALAALIPAAFANRGRTRRRLIAPVRESIGHDLGAAVMRRFSEQRWLVPRWQHLERSLSNCAVLKERWPEFLEGEEPKFPALPNFDLLVSISFGLEEGSVLAHWSMYYGGGEQLARRIRDDSRYRDAIAEMLGVEADELVEKAATALPEMRFPDHWANSNAIDVLKGEA